MEIRIHKILKGSRANGPGLRNTVWIQGCMLDCPGCFNPQTHDPKGGQSISVRALCTELLSCPCDGITISGGEPFQQPQALHELLRLLQQRCAPPILVFSGYTYRELLGNEDAAACLPLIDALICGPFRREIAPAYDRFCSSANQKLVLLTDRYSQKDFAGLPLREFVFDTEGNVTVSGILQLPGTESGSFSAAR